MYHKRCRRVLWKSSQLQTNLRIGVWKKLTHQVSLYNIDQYILTLGGSMHSHVCHLTQVWGNCIMLICNTLPLKQLRYMAIYLTTCTNFMQFANNYSHKFGGSWHSSYWFQQIQMLLNLVRSSYHMVWFKKHAFRTMVKVETMTIWHILKST